MLGDGEPILIIYNVCLLNANKRSPNVANAVYSSESPLTTSIKKLRGNVSYLFGGVYIILSRIIFIILPNVSVWPVLEPPVVATESSKTVALVIEAT